MGRVHWILVCGLALAACDDDGDSATPDLGAADAAADSSIGPDAADAEIGTDAALADAARDGAPGDAAPADASTPDAGSPNEVENIGEALAEACPRGGNPSNPPNSLARGDDLHRVTLDDPRAICNDGTPAVMYVRRAQRAAAEGRWVFHLQGGSACRSYDDCRDRWCGRQGIYDASKMSSRFAPPAIGGKGIFEADADNDFNAANHVFVYYCSSDSWVGQRDDVVYASASRAGERFSLHVRGHSILEAMVERLQAGEVTSDDGIETLPDLDTAQTVLWSGVSAGSGGAKHNLDWFADQLSGDTRVVGVFDAGFRPDLGDVSDDALRALLVQATLRRYGVDWAGIEGFGDTSCLAAHPEDPQVCADTTHTMLHHITTPWFQRTDLTDRAGSGSYTENGVPVRAFAADSRATLARFPNAEPEEAMDFVPGIYAPNCGQHVGITNNFWFGEATLDDQGTPRTYHDALRRWISGEPVHLVDTHPASLSVCGDVTDDGS